MPAYRVFTIEDGKPSEGADIGDFKLSGAGRTIPAIVIGEMGRNRERGVLPIATPPMAPCPQQGKDVWDHAEKCSSCGVAMGPKTPGTHTRSHPLAGEVRGRLMAAEIGQTQGGRPKLLAQDAPDATEKVLVVFRTRIGYRGGNSHTGDRTPETRHLDSGASFLPFPGEIICRGRIAQGDAGGMGAGEHLVALMPKGVVFRTGYSGRLYGAPSSHYYKWDGERLMSITWDERVATDLF